MPRLDQKTKERVLELAFPTDGQQPLNATQVITELSQENARLSREEYVITSERSVQKYIKKVKLQETESMELDRQPWSLLLSDKAGIPFCSGYYFTRNVNSYNIAIGLGYIIWICGRAPSLKVRG